MVSIKQKILTHLWFDTQAQEAATFYCSIFPDSAITRINLLKDTPSGDCELVDFQLCGQRFMAISAGPYFTFNEAISLLVYCDDQAQIDYYWQALSAEPNAEQCGWLKDKFGVSWQIAPRLMDEVFAQDNPELQGRVLNAVLGMKKIDLAVLTQICGETHAH
jgi:predicted 3-demethylubiquinone-9 3-methyltransferase (glyoxalase superfamily)